MRPAPPAWLVGLVLVVAVLSVAAGFSVAGFAAEPAGGVAGSSGVVAEPPALDRGDLDGVAETAPEEAPASLAGTAPGAGPAPSVDEGLTVRTELRRVEAAGEYGATTRVVVPDRVTHVEVTLPEGARPVEATGFAAADGGRTYEWDGSTPEPRLRYRMDANLTGGRGPLAGDGEYRFVDADEWALVRMPNLRVGWRGYGADVRLRREYGVDGEGAAGGVIAYLGPGAEHVREAHGQRFRLFVPAAADLEEPPEEVLAALADSSDALRVGDRDPSVFVVAAPTGDVSWAVRGLQTGPADAWVRDSERLDDPENVWIHEYVHTRQRRHRQYAAESTRWFTEASATYYAALLTLERGDVGFDEFRRVLTRGERSPGAESVLSEPSTWQNAADYTKGALVAGEIDRRIRLATGGEATLATVFRDLNARGEPADGESFVGLVEDAGGATVADDAERFTTTRAVPSAWDRPEHDEAFGRFPARIGYSIAGDGAVRATGPYRNRSVARDPIVLAPGETLAVAVAIENAGGTAGEYDLTLVVDDRVAQERNGRVAANETKRERFERTFDAPGEHEVHVGGEQLAVVVREPATPTVAGLAVSPTRLEAGEAVTVTATVRNDAARPGRGTFPLVVGDGERDPREVFLDAGGEATIEWTIRPDRAGELDVGVGDRARTITVTAKETSGAAPSTGAGEGDGNGEGNQDDDGTAGATSGFGPAAALVAIVATLLATAARRDG